MLLHEEHFQRHPALGIWRTLPLDWGVPAARTRPRQDRRIDPHRRLKARQLRRKMCGGLPPECGQIEGRRSDAVLVRELGRLYTRDAVAARLTLYRRHQIPDAALRHQT